MAMNVKTANEGVTNALLRYRGAVALGQREGIVEALIELCRTARDLHLTAQDALFKELDKEKRGL